MKNIFNSFSILIFILSACSASVEPTPTAEPTIMPEPTLEPVYLEGTLFFDKNATGLQDEATYLPCTNQRCDAISEMEPGLKGFEVCAQLEDETYCAITEQDGNFSIELPSEQTGPLHVYISNPEGVSTEQEMRWINKFNKMVTIPVYTLKGKEGWNIVNGVPTKGILDQKLFFQGDIPEQTLYDTDLIKLSNGIELKMGEENSIGLMKGMIVYPFRVEDFAKLDVRGGFDHDPDYQQVIDFAGNTNTAYANSNWYLGCVLDEDSNSPFICSYDGHAADDFGYEGSPKGIPLFAAENGFLGVIEDPRGGIAITIWPIKEGVPHELTQETAFDLENNPDNLVQLGYSHCDSVTVAMYDYVYRGQLIGFIGNTGTMTNYPHVHFSTQFGSPSDRGTTSSSKYVKDLYAMIVPEFVKKGYNDLSIWTDWNQPVFYPIKLELEWTP